MEPIKKYEDIMKNKKAVNNVFTTKQLEVIMKYLSNYDFPFEARVYTVAEASEIIKNLIYDARCGKLKRRPKNKRFNPDVLYFKFIEKYPEIYDEIISR